MIKGIIFDLGNTLVRFSGDADSTEQAGSEALVTWYLKKKHIKLDGAALSEIFLAERKAAWERASQEGREVLAQESLRMALSKIEAPPVTTALLEAAIKVFFGPEEELYQCYPDAVETLKLLKGRGYKLGLYSNATDDPLIQRLVNRNGLRPWLSPTFSSAGCGWRKPRREAFALIADRWGLDPSQVAVVGDTLKADILGAHQAGMAGILAAMDEAPSNEANRQIRPAAVIKGLAELPNLVKQL